MIQRLFGKIPAANFLAEHYQKVPFALAGAAQELIPLGNWQTIGAILAQPNPDVMVVRGGERWTGTHPTTIEQAQQLSSEGYTLLVRHAEHHCPALAEWSAGFAQDLCGEVNIHLYCTPASQFGFGWHYDAEEVFIIQTTGSKEYSLRKNTVNPWPVPQMIPPDMHYEREIMPMMRCNLHAGDWLYIPSGYWHMGRADAEAISLAIGVMPTTGVDMFDFLRPHVLASLRWRQRFPVPQADDASRDTELLDGYRLQVESLADDLARMLRDPKLLAQFVAQRQELRVLALGAGLPTPPAQH